MTRLISPVDIAGAGKTAIGSPHSGPSASCFADSAGAGNSEAARNSHYSSRNARIGSIDAARIAGSADAATASSSTPNAASASTSGSNGLTPNSIDRSKLEAATLRPVRSRNPPRPALRPTRITSRIIAARCEPSAMRIAISCTREATENAITL